MNLYYDSHFHHCQDKDHKMEVELIVTTQQKLEKENILHIGKIVNSVFKEQLVGGKGKKLCGINTDDDGIHHTFTFETDNTEEMCDILASELYTKLEFDFEVQIECEVDEDYLEPCEDDSGVMLIDDDDESQEHAKWVSDSISEGWVYGSEHSPKEKRTPFLKPYHTLTDTQKEVMIKSKNSSGVYGVDMSVLSGHYVGGSHDNHGSGDGGGDGGGE